MLATLPAETKINDATVHTVDGKFVVARNVYFSVKMAVFKHRALDIRWLRKPRYRKFVVIVSILFSINVFLVCNLVSSYNDPAVGEEDPSGRGRYHLDVRICLY